MFFIEQYIYIYIYILNLFRDLVCYAAYQDDGEAEILYIFFFVCVLVCFANYIAWLA